MNNKDHTGLKLVGKNKEDLKIISAYLQDSVVIIKDIVFLKENKTFILIVNRFMWEDVEKGVFRQNKRIRCAIKFEEVFKVISKKINHKNKDKILECLAIESHESSEGHHRIDIFFSGGNVITVIAEIIEVSFTDLGKPWNVKHMPKHKI
tara:strand:+ start:547 stop:996 length:450 start_codon:yes stop_codon:yes gene_type:complete